MINHLTSGQVDMFTIINEYNTLDMLMSAEIYIILHDTTFLKCQVLELCCLSTPILCCPLVASCDVVKISLVCLGVLDFLHINLSGVSVCLSVCVHVY